MWREGLRSGPMQDQMESFTTRRAQADTSPHSSRASSLSGYLPGPIMGPIMKIREKTEKSVPMFKKPDPRTPLGQQLSLKSYSSRRGSDNSSIAGSGNCRIIWRLFPANALAASRGFLSHSTPLHICNWWRWGRLPTIEPIVGGGIDRLEFPDKDPLPPWC